jgi:hypothetical protein
MKKTLVLLICLTLTKINYATVIITDINKTLDTVVTNYQLDYSGDGVYDVTFNVFLNGAISVTGRVGGGNSTYFHTGTISGSNNYPVRVGNNKTFENETVWKANPIFIYNPVLNYTDFAGKGNQYIVGRTNYGGIDQYYFWILINVNAQGNKLTIVKCGYENEANIPLSTGNEAIENNTGLMINEPDAQVLLFPSPAKSEIEVQGMVVTSYKIFDTNGKLVQENEHLNAQKIDVAILPKNMYILQLQNANNNIVTKKITLIN